MKREWKKYDYGNNWQELRIEALRLSNYTCERCHFSTREPRKLEVHHRLPLSKGGKNCLSNLKVLCVFCHKNEHPFMARMKAKKNGPIKLKPKYGARL